MTRLAVIIVNYNTKAVLRECLTNLSQLALRDTKVLVVDNGSSDGSADMEAAEFPAVSLIRTENNGLAAGYNLGLAHAGECHYYLFLGTDAFPQPGCIEGVLEFMAASPTIGVATAKLVLRSGQPDMDAHRGFPTPLTALTHFCGFNSRYFLTARNMSAPHDIDLCISHFMAVSNAVFTKVGLWDTDYFLYGEDVDMCWRVKQAGFRIMYLPQFTCLHYKGVSIGIRKASADITPASSATKHRVQQESVRAMRLFYRKHMYSAYPWLVNKLVEVGLMVITRLRK
jgi:hypothetical protein